MLIFNLFYKFFIMLTMLFISFTSFFLQDKIMIWFFMEINNFLFISYMCFKVKNKKIIFMYYLIQTLSALILMFSLILNNFFTLFNSNFITFMFYLAIMLKLAIPPFHFWMPLITIQLPWDILFILLSIQKFIPFYLLSNTFINSKFFYLMVLSSSFISTFKMLNLKNMKLLLTYSSINQSSWMLILIFYKNLFWILYMSTYTIILLMICILLEKNLFYFYSNHYWKYNLLLLLCLFNLSSMPPLTFFLMKWFSIYLFLKYQTLYFIFILLLFNSFLLLYIYLNMLLISLFMYKTKNKMLSMLKKFPLLKKMTMMIILFLLLILSLIFIML